MMTCKEVVEFLMEYLDGELPPAQRVEFERHLAMCRTCVDYLDSYRETIKAGKAAFVEPESPLPEELVRVILASRELA